ncbi:hypothetical protein GCM10023194_04720 [Planotetraspora phitsanulokensis]|uniref:ABC transporter domain-containing protein n=1 Tax=Planotetraspora phitsanulokensis TaxID=575192 RepID=A0A8J3XGD0_9ACTN|nr:ATP-binding cassette domain-containing protein [Planotetraspora phitsanulokensis]GII40672.1 hypothetical protein Pph01_56750 [Planotetraspora phitsanulokensis]
MTVQDAAKTAAFMGADARADRLSLNGPHGWVYRDVSLRAAPGTLTVIEGEAGSGRTSLLLTLAGRMRPTEGMLTVDGLTSRHKIQRIAALGLLTEVNAFDDALSVREHLNERLRFRRRRNTDVVRAAFARAGLDPGALPDGDRTLVRRLMRDQTVRLGIALALLDEPRLLVVDDTDSGLPEDRRRALWRTLRELADAGLTVIATCTDTRMAGWVADAVVTLTPAADTSAIDTAVTATFAAGASVPGALQGEQ